MTTLSHLNLSQSYAAAFFRYQPPINLYGIDPQTPHVCLKQAKAGVMAIELATFARPARDE